MVSYFTLSDEVGAGTPHFGRQSLKVAHTSSPARHAVFSNAQAAPIQKWCLVLGREQLGKLYAHVELASRINRAIDERALEELGTLEQDLVYGDATSKEVITFLSNKDNAGALPADKVRQVLLQMPFSHPMFPPD